MKQQTRRLRRGGRHTVSGIQQAEDILRFARQVLREHGAAGFSVRKVSQAAGISIGHLQHYFPTRSDLLRAILVDMEQRFHNHYADAISVIDDPVRRLDACADFILDDEVANFASVIMREFWSLGAHDADIAASLDDFYAGFRQFTSRVVREANPVLDEQAARQISSTLVATFSGAFIYLDPRQDRDDRQAFLAYLQSLPARLTFAEQLPDRAVAAR